MSKIKITLPDGDTVSTGKLISFKAPCDCVSASYLHIDDDDYVVVDALGTVITGSNSGWKKDAMVSVILNVESHMAYLQTSVIPISYGTTDLEAGVSPLETGKFYFVYE